MKPVFLSLVLLLFMNCSEKETQTVAKELPENRKSEHLAHFLVMGIYGLRTFSQSHPDKNILEALADQLFNSIRY